MLRRIFHMTTKNIDEENKYIAETKKYYIDKIIHAINKRNFFPICMAA